jgi:hypothetical protein
MPPVPRINTIAQLDALINNMSPAELRLRENFVRIMGFITNGGNSQELIPHFMVNRGIRIYGGINEYIDNFLQTFDKDRLDATGKQATRLVFQKMLTREPSDENRARIQASLQELTGGRKSRKNKSKRRRSKKYKSI